MDSHRMSTDVNCIYAGDPSLQKEAEMLIDKYPQVFFDKIGKALNLVVDIELIDKTVVNLRPCHLSPPTLHKVEEILKKWVDEKTIEPSTSPYSSPAFLTKTNCLVVNYGELNKKNEEIMSSARRHAEHVHAFKRRSLRVVC